MGFTVKRVLRRVLRRGSEKAVSRRCLERPLDEYAPLGGRPISARKSDSVRCHLSRRHTGALAKKEKRVRFHSSGIHSHIQEWPRKTKPKKGQFMNFSRGRSGTKVQCESCLFSQGKTSEFTKMGEIHELFVLPLSLVWFAGATPFPHALIFLSFVERGEKTPTPKTSALLRKRPVLLRANFVLTKDRKRPYYRHFGGKLHREGSCSKAAGGP